MDSTLNPEVDRLIASTTDCTQDESTYIKEVIRKKGYRWKELAERWPIEADEVEAEEWENTV